MAEATATAAPASTDDGNRVDGSDGGARTAARPTPPGALSRYQVLLALLVAVLAVEVLMMLGVADPGRVDGPPRIKF